MEPTSIIDYFSQLPDPRPGRNTQHKFTDIIILSILAVLCGAESYDSIEEFGKARIDSLKQFLQLPNGIPSHDTINRVISMVKPEQFEKIFSQWASSLKGTKGSNEVIAIDGKTVRGSKDSFHNKAAIPIVSAWASPNSLVLGQRKVDGKSNEITAIPELLDMLELKGCIVTIDAMGTQKHIAKKIIKNNADYVLALKGNQDYLKQDVKSLCKRLKPDWENQTIEKGHGRIETRICEVYNKIDLLEDYDKWPGFKSVIKVTAQREIRDKLTSETRFYISSLDHHAKDFNKYIRQHWGVENQLHWTLDMIFREDEQRKRNKYAAQNFAVIRKIALNLLKKEGSKKLSLRTKRLKAAWDSEFLLKILQI